MWRSLRGLAGLALSLLLLGCDPAPTRGDVPAPSPTPAPAQEPEAMSEPKPEPKPKPELGGGDRPVGPSYSRSPVYAQRGMVATAHPLASQIALKILQDGGTAVDAAIGANAALGLMEPIGNGVGGDLFAIVWDPKTERLYGYNGSGRSPKGRSLADLRGKLGDAAQIPAYGSLPVTVPGTVDAWFALHQRFGRLSMHDILGPTIMHARHGFPVTPVIADAWRANMAAFERAPAGQIEEFDNARATYLFDGQAPVAGQIISNPDLGNTLIQLATGGREAFYTGPIARTIDAYMRRIGGDLRFEDFAKHRGEWVEPGFVDYRGYRVHELPPNGQGYAALQMLAILEHVELAKLDRAGPELLHYVIEAKRLAFEDLAAVYADPAFSPAPLERLLSKDYARERFALINPDHASAQFAPGEALLDGPGDTTYLTVADGDGMMVSLIQSNYRGMGSGLVPDHLGFMLQDRGQLFALTDGHPNVYAPGKRPFHTIIPAFVTKDGEPWLSFGVMGGSMQPQGHVQILINLIDFGMDLQAAGDAARIRHDGGRQPTGVDEHPLGVVYVESGVPQATVEALRAMGHVVERGGGGFGGYQAIMRPTNDWLYVGATEMRKDGLAIGY